MKKSTMGLLSVLTVCGITVLGLIGSGFCPGKPEGSSCGSVKSCQKKSGCSVRNCGTVKSSECPGKSCPVQSGEVSAGTWGVDYQAALDASRRNGRPVFAFFTGSDWCGWCMKLDREVLTQDQFKKWAAGKVNLLKIDFPQGGNQSAAERKANEALMRKYGVRGFPTIVLLDKNGKEISRTGYRRGGAESYVKHLEDLLK